MATPRLSDNKMTQCNHSTPLRLQIRNNQYRLVVAVVIGSRTVIALGIRKRSADERRDPAGTPCPSYRSSGLGCSARGTVFFIASSRLPPRVLPETRPSAIRCLAWDLAKDGGQRNVILSHHKLGEQTHATAHWFVEIMGRVPWP